MVSEKDTHSQPVASLGMHTLTHAHTHMSTYIHTLHTYIVSNPRGYCYTQSNFQNKHRPGGRKREKWLTPSPLPSRKNGSGPLGP